MVDFFEMDFMKDIVILVKVDEMYNILISASHGLLVERWRWNWVIKVFARVCYWMSLYVYYVPSYLRGRLHLVTDTDAEKEFDNAT